MGTLVTIEVEDADHFLRQLFETGLGNVAGSIRIGDTPVDMDYLHRVDDLRNRAQRKIVVRFTKSPAPCLIWLKEHPVAHSELYCHDDRAA